MNVACETNAIVIRTIAEEDADGVAALSAQLGYEALPETMRARIRRLSANPQSQSALVACVDGEVVGWIEVAISCHLQSETHSVIGGLVVRDDMRGQRIGARLLSEAEAWSRRQGVAVVRVRSQIARNDAHRFYLREGYSQVKTSLVFEKKV